MNTNPLSRRIFLRNAAVLSGALPLLSPLGLTGAELQREQNATTTNAAVPGRIKVGCTSWAFHNLSTGESPEKSIDILGEMGFDGVELIINTPQDLTELWSDAKISEVRRQLEKYDMEVSQMAMFQPVVEDLTSLDESKRVKALDNFEAGTVIAKKLGANLVNIVAPWPREVNRPGGGYLPRYYDRFDATPGVGPKFALEIDPSFDWQAVWDRFVVTIRDCLERVKVHEMRFTIENHTHTVIPDTSSFLLLWDALKDDALGYNLDAGWVQLQREYPPVAIYKSKNHLLNLHMRDIDGAMRSFVHIGDGVMDFRGIIKALKAINFSGYVSLEQDKHPGDMKTTCKRYLDLMRKLIAET